MPEKCIICGKPIDLFHALLARIGNHVVHHECKVSFQDWLIEKYLETHPAHPEVTTSNEPKKKRRRK